MNPQKLQPRFNGSAIAERRRALKLSQDEVGKKTGITRYQIIRIEKGESGSLDSLAAICRVLEMPLQEVFAPLPVSSA